MRTYGMLITLFGLVSNVMAQNRATEPSSLPVQELKVTDRTLNILAALADKYHVVIGVSGTIVGSDNQRIAVSVKNARLADVFDAITSQDPRFLWEESTNGAVHFITRRGPLPLMDLALHSFDLVDPGDADITGRLLRVPEVADWLKSQQCDMDELRAGPPPKRRMALSIHAEEAPFSAVLDEIAVKSGNYFWSSIRYSETPCEINIRP